MKHHVALSIVGTDCLEGNGYFFAKVAQERLIAASGLPFTIVRATQFFEFVATIAQASVAGDRIVVPDADFQPIAAADVAAALADVALAPPRNATIEIAGPDRLPFRDFVAHSIASTGDRREVLADRRRATSALRSARVRLFPSMRKRHGSGRRGSRAGSQLPEPLRFSPSTKKDPFPCSEHFCWAPSLPSPSFLRWRPMLRGARPASRRSLTIHYLRFQARACAASLSSTVRTGPHRPTPTPHLPSSQQL